VPEEKKTPAHPLPHPPSPAGSRRWPAPHLLPRLDPGAVPAPHLLPGTAPPPTFFPAPPRPPPSSPRRPAPHLLSHAAPTFRRRAAPTIRRRTAPHLPATHRPTPPKRRPPHTPTIQAPPRYRPAHRRGPPLPPWPFDAITAGRSTPPPHVIHCSSTLDPPGSLSQRAAADRLPPLERRCGPSPTSLPWHSTVDCALPHLPPSASWWNHKDS
uniref:Uncharacterized protein n=10 Tax=Aegilops tauschii subsp. strangulata TaxID=200361 RepID=A0A453CC32_AEGTS